MLAIIQATGVIQSVIIAACLGFLLGMLVVIVWERKNVVGKNEYIDWSKVPSGYNYAGINGKNDIVWMAKTKLHHDGEWLESEDDSLAHMPGIARIGPLPPWLESLRRRPS